MDDAILKSRQLLIDNLTPGQRHEFEIAGKFTVKTKGGDCEVKPGTTERLHDKKHFCATIPGLPVYDQMLARKLYLEQDPESFFKMANQFNFEIRWNLNNIRPHTNDWWLILKGGEK